MGRIIWPNRLEIGCTGSAEQDFLLLSLGNILVRSMFLLCKWRLSLYILAVSKIDFILNLRLP